MKLTIKNTSIEHAAAVYALLCELEDTAFPEKDFYDLYKHNLQQDHIGYFVAEIDGQVVGFASVHINLLLHHCGKIAEIQELVVDNQYRNQKIGRQLVQHIIEWSKQQGALQVEVSCNNKRTDAHRFYQANGFLPTHQKLVLQY